MARPKRLTKKMFKDVFARAELRLLVVKGMKMPSKEAYQCDTDALITYLYENKEEFAEISISDCNIRTDQNPGGCFREGIENYAMDLQDFILEGGDPPVWDVDEEEEDEEEVADADTDGSKDDEDDEEEDEEEEEDEDGDGDGEDEVEEPPAKKPAAKKLLKKPASLPKKPASLPKKAASLPKKAAPAKKVTRKKAKVEETTLEEEELPVKAVRRRSLSPRPTESKKVAAKVEEEPEKLDEKSAEELEDADKGYKRAVRKRSRKSTETQTDKMRASVGNKTPPTESMEFQINALTAAISTIRTGHENIDTDLKSIVETLKHLGTLDAKVRALGEAVEEVQTAIDKRFATVMKGQRIIANGILFLVNQMQLEEDEFLAKLAHVPKPEAYMESEDEIEEGEDEELGEMIGDFKSEDD
jgi:hypothetical protein